MVLSTAHTIILFMQHPAKRADLIKQTKKPYSFQKQHDHHQSEELALFAMGVLGSLAAFKAQNSPVRPIISKKMDLCMVSGQHIGWVLLQVSFSWAPLKVVDKISNLRKLISGEHPQRF